MSEQQSLRASILRGGSLLFVRQMISLGLKVVGILLITRLLGPERYAPFVAANNIYQYTMIVGDLGVGVFLIRHADGLTERDFRTAYSLLLLVACALAGLVEVGQGWIASWVNVSGIQTTLPVMILALPVQLCTVPAMARLERNLEYRSVAATELLGQVSYYALALPLIYAWQTPTALVLAFLLQTAVTFAAAHFFARRLPSFGWDTHTVAQILNFATGFSVSSWLWQLRGLINPLIVGHFLGAQAVGLVGMTIGILDTITFIRSIAWRLSVSVLRRLRDDHSRMIKAITQGIEIQVVLIGGLLLAFAVLGQFIISVLFGSRWQSVMELYPFVAASYLTQAFFTMYTSALLILNLNRYVAVFHLIHVTVLGVGAWYLVPKFGVLGYGLAELSTIPTYLLLQLIMIRAIKSPTSLLSLLWFSALVIGLFWHVLGVWTLAITTASLLNFASLTRIRSLIRMPAKT